MKHVLRIGIPLLNVLLGIHLITTYDDMVSLITGLLCITFFGGMLLLVFFFLIWKIIVKKRA